MAQKPTLNEFLTLPEEDIFNLVYPKKLNVSILVNGTRRWYLTLKFEQPPEKELNHAELLDLILQHMSKLFDLMASLGIYRIFAPAYSKAQVARDKPAHESLLKGLTNLHNHPSLVSLYHNRGFRVYFPGDLHFLPQDKIQEIQAFSQSTRANNRHVVYYDINKNNSYDYLFKLAYEFIQCHQRPPTWEDMAGLYYDDPSIGELNILICHGRFYGRTGIPPLMGNLNLDRMYATAVSPLLLSATQLRRILYDYLYVNPPQNPHYRNISHDDLARLKAYYQTNRNKVLGLTQLHGQFIYPVEELVWPKTFFNPSED